MDQNINFNVFNMLNLHNEKLGKLYLEKGFNPYGDNFNLSVEEVVNVLDLQKNEKTINFPSFLEKSPKEIKKAYQNSAKNTEKIEAEIKDDKEMDEETRTYLSRYMQMRKALLEIEIENMSAENFDETASFQEISSLDKLVGDFMEQTFENSPNNDFILSQIKTLLKNRKELKKEKEKQAKLQRELAIMNMKVIENVQKEKAKKQFNKLKKYDREMERLTKKIEKENKSKSILSDVATTAVTTALKAGAIPAGFVKEALTGAATPFCQGFLQGWGHNALHPEKWFEKNPNYEKMSYEQAKLQTEQMQEQQRELENIAKKMQELKDELSR